jgi:predicted RNase H-like HicB family nuclease
MSTTMKYLVIFEETRTGYSALSPDLPGCVATGSSREEVEKNMKDAVAFHLEGIEDEGPEISKPHSFPTCLEVPA